MIDILLNYILKSDEGIEKNLNEQIMNDLENKEEYFNDLLFGLHNWSTNCFLNSSIQLLLRCWDGFEKISKLQNNDNGEFITWLNNSFKNKIWECGKNSQPSETLRISLNFIYEFFNFGKIVNDEKGKFRNGNINKITKENARAVHGKMLQQHEKLVKIWREYGIKVEKDESFRSQSDSYDALRFFFNCLQDVICVFDNKQKPISEFKFSCGTGKNSKNVEIKLSYEKSVEFISCDLNIQKIEDLWKKNVLIKEALLDKMPLYYKLFGLFQVDVRMCTKCNLFYCSSTISCINNVHIDDFVCWKHDSNVDTAFICKKCQKNDNIIYYKFLIPIGKYFFIGNADAATNRDLAGKTWNSEMKKLKSWKDDTYNFGEGNDYRNIGVGIHSGSVGENSGGHYWAYIRSRYLKDLYFKCDDDHFPYDNPVVVYTPNSNNHERIYLFEKIENK